MLQVFMAWLPLRADRRGVAALEYALIAALIAVVIAVGATALGTSVNGMFNKVATAI